MKIWGITKCVRGKCNTLRSAKGNTCDSGESIMLPLRKKARFNVFLQSDKCLRIGE